jgi:hypothetical protein
MKPPTLIALLVAAAPLAAFSQVSYSHARIESSESRARIEPVAPIAGDDVRICLDRRDSFNDRKAFYEREKRATDIEGVAIGREGARLAVEMRGLNSSDVAAVAAYNARSDANNQRVAAYNLHVADMTSAAAMLSADASDLTAYCNFRGTALSLR